MPYNFVPDSFHTGVTVNNQRKQNKHLGIKEDLHRLFGHRECVIVTSRT